MNRTRFFTLLAGGAAATIVAVPAFAEDGKEGKERAELAAKDSRSENAKQKLEELAQRIKARVGQGTVKSVDTVAKSFVLTTKQGDVTVTTDSSTTYHQGRSQTLTIDDVKVGSHVVVQADRPAAGATATPAPTPAAATLLARRIVILPEKKERPQRTVTVGTTGSVSVAANGTGSFTLTPVTPAGASAVTFSVDADTVYTLKGTPAFANGQRARVVSIKNDAGQNLARQIQVPARD